MTPGELPPGVVVPYPGPLFATATRVVRYGYVFQKSRSHRSSQEKPVSRRSGSPKLLLMMRASSPVCGSPSYPTAANVRWSSIDPKSPSEPATLQHAAIPMTRARGAVPKTSSAVSIRLPNGCAAIVDVTKLPWLMR